MGCTVSTKIKQIRPDGWATIRSTPRSSVCALDRHRGGSIILITNPNGSDRNVVGNPRVLGNSRCSLRDRLTRYTQRKALWEAKTPDVASVDMTMSKSKLCRK